MTGLARETQAGRILRGVVRHLFQRGLIALPEVTLPNGRRADLMALSRSGEIWIVEIKSSVEDFQVDRKWPVYRQFCDRFFFATHADVPQTVFPAEEGLFVADAYGAAMIREAEKRPELAAATRKSLLIQLSWMGSQRYWSMLDPDAFHADF
jgi:hypothetical protein